MKDSLDRDLHLSKEEEFVNQLDPELDLRNINFATGENQYLNRRSEEDFEIDY